MRGVFFVARADLRRRWKAVALLTVVVGIVGGVVLTAAAGARRTSTSFDRFVASTRPGHATMTLGTDDEAEIAALVGRIARLPQVEGLVWADGVAVVPEGTGEQSYVPVGAQVGEPFGAPFDLGRLLSGRLADPAAAHEVTLAESTAALLGVSVGDTLAFLSFTPEQGAALQLDENAVGDPEGPTVRIRVVGIVRTPGDLNVGDFDVTPIFLTPAFSRRYGADVGSFAPGFVRARLRGGDADLPAFTRAVERVAGPDVAVNFEPISFEAARVQDSIDVLAVGIGLFAVAAGLAGIVAVGIVVGRQISGAAGEHAALRALGLGQRARACVLAVPVVVAVLGGALLAIVLAFVASPLVPIGLARRAEPDPGLSFDGLVLVGGAAVLVAVVVALAVVAAWRASRRVGLADAPRSGTARPPVAERLARIGVGAPAVTGVRMALEPGRGRTAVPVRAALAGAAVGIAGVVAVVLFAGSLDRLLDTPARYGWNWDVLGGGQGLVRPERVAADPAVAALAEARFTDVEIVGRPVDAVGFEQLKGTVFLTLADGRAARRADEVVLGTDTLATHGLDIGDHVTASGPLGSRTFRIVGRGIFPPVDDNAVLADGAAFTVEGLASIVEDDERGVGGYTVMLVRFAPGAHEQGIRALRAAGSEPPESANTPAEIDQLAQVERLPHVLAGFLALLALLAIAHALVTGVRRRGRDLAVLKTLGFARRQLQATVAWQATTFVLVGLGVGIPVGMVVGRLVWGMVADGLGVATDVAVPIVVVAVVAVAALIVANLVAALPARAAARTQPAVVLRSE